MKAHNAASCEFPKSPNPKESWEGRLVLRLFLQLLQPLPLLHPSPSTRFSLCPIWRSREVAWRTLARFLQIALETNFL